MLTGKRAVCIVRGLTITGAKMPIVDIQRSRHRLPLEPPFYPAWGSEARTTFTLDLVRVVTDDGLEGVGAGDAMPGFDGHEALFLDRDPLDLGRHTAIVDNLSFHYGRCWPVEVALWDLAGKKLGLPVWKLLGGTGAGRLACYASTGTLRATEATVDAVEAIRDAGFPAVKLRFQRGDWRDDVGVVEAVRERVGDALAIMVDCNQAWRMPWDVAAPWTFRQALACARALEDLGVFWMEEPLHRGDHTGMARLRDAVDLRIAGGEMTRETHEVTHLTDTGALDVLQQDAVLCGGIGGLARTFAAARERGLEISPHTWGHGIGLLANAHLAAGVGGCPYLEYPYDPPAWTPARRDFGLADELRLADGGVLELGSSPGLGIRLDEDKLAATAV